MIYYCFLMQSKGANLEGNGKNKEKTKKCRKKTRLPRTNGRAALKSLSYGKEGITRAAP